ncbi:MAG: fibro-slime domain-containing protein [Oscillospiraceae bacterium]|nr:fibro-slime domain-containing protein [Oscillospiraceae bacterium]
MKAVRSDWKPVLRRGIALLLFFCLFAGLLPQGVWAQTGGEPKEATRAATDYVSIAADLAKPLVLNRRVETNLALAEIHKLSGSYIVVSQTPISSSYWAINPHAVSDNYMQMTKVNVQTSASEAFNEGSIANYPQYIKNLDKTVAENLAMTFSYDGDVAGPANGYLTDVGWDGGSASFAFRIFRSDGAEMQFSDGGPGIETNGGAVTMGLKFSAKKTDKPTVRLYRSIRNAAASPKQALGGYAFQGNAFNGSPVKNHVLKIQTSPDGIIAYVQFFQSTEPNGGNGDRSHFFLFEHFGKEAAFLYTAITEAAAYLQQVVSADPDSANTRAFTAAFQNAVNAYKKYNVLPMPKDADPRGDMIKAAERLIAFYSFIDIPVEILDFRSDLFMMEHDNDYFGLVHDYNTDPNLFSTSAGNLTLPGQVQYTSQNVPHFRTGLMMDKLHNGYPMYKEEVVDFVAKLLYYKGKNEDMYNYTETKRLDRLNSHNIDWNKTFYNLIRNGSVYLGDLDSVLENTSEGNYGDSLFWSNMDKNSCYALAYYMLTNLWRPVEEESSYAYNTKVAERTSLRLFTDIDGLYTIDSGQNISYDGYMGNVMPRVNRDVSTWQVPCFTPIDGLGFEKNGKETDLSPYALDGYKNTNYNFTMHAYGSFVYYKDQDLYFEFSGDDDVYFYVNNILALDLGGSHTAAKDSVNLNAKADVLGLVDGEVYTFDMFYAERRTEGSNLKFATNIKIVDTDTLTTKGQYLDTESGVSMVDPTTGKGPELIDYAPVSVGDTVAYSFELRNTRDVPVKMLSFTDATLGVTASHGTVTLNGITKITDLRLYYTTVSGDVLSTSAPVVKTASQMNYLLNEANKLSGASYGSLPAGCYRVNITSADMLKELLALGVPVDCKLSLYGFKRVVQAEDTPYINTLYSDCLTVDGKLITGTASRVITAFVAPKGKDTTLVLDYGKPIRITAAQLKKSITIASGSSVAVGNCVGLFSTNGYSGQLLKDRPSIVNRYDGAQGSFTFAGSAITYTPAKLLEGADSVFAVYEISGCTVTKAGGKAVTYPYILLQLRTVPAASVYYEAESFKSELTYLEKRTNSSGVETFYRDWDQAGAANDIKEEGTAATDNLQEYQPVGADHPYGYDPSYRDDTKLSNGESL